MPLFISYLDSSTITLCDILRFQIDPYRLRGNNYSPRISKDKSSGKEEFLRVGFFKKVLGAGSKQKKSHGEPLWN